VHFTEQLRTDPTCPLGAPDPSAVCEFRRAAARRSPLAGPARACAVLAACLLAACADTQPAVARGPAAAPERASVVAAAAAPRLVPAPALPAARSNDEYQRRMALRLLAANPNITYSAPAPAVLLAIPVLAVEVNADGSVRRIEVMRVPTQARDTVQIAIDAVHRAAPFGDVTALAKPWKFTQVFLFDDARRFKPRVLD